MANGDRIPIEIVSIDEIFPELKCHKLIIDILIEASKLEIIGTIQQLDIIRLDQIPDLILNIIQNIVNNIKILLDECDISRLRIKKEDIYEILFELGNLKYENAAIVGSFLSEIFYDAAVECRLLHESINRRM